MAERIIDLPTEKMATDLRFWLRERIVRCRDCDFSQKDGTCCILFAGWEPVEGGDEYELVSADVEPDGFCKWGERKEGEEVEWKG